jgi:hypothetical protein
MRHLPLELAVELARETNPGAATIKIPTRRPVTYLLSAKLASFVQFQPEPRARRRAAARR